MFMIGTRLKLWLFSFVCLESVILLLNYWGHYFEGWFVLTNRFYCFVCSSYSRLLSREHRMSFKSSSLSLHAGTRNLPRHTYRLDEVVVVPGSCPSCTGLYLVLARA